MVFWGISLFFCGEIGVGKSVTYETKKSVCGVFTSIGAIERLIVSLDCGDVNPTNVQRTGFWVQRSSVGILTHSKYGTAAY